MVPSQRQALSLETKAVSVPRGAALWLQIRILLGFWLRSLDRGEGQREWIRFVSDPISQQRERDCRRDAARVWAGGRASYRAREGRNEILLQFANLEALSLSVSLSVCLSVCLSLSRPTDSADSFTMQLLRDSGRIALPTFIPFFLRSFLLNAAWAGLGKAVIKC